MGTSRGSPLLGGLLQRSIFRAYGGPRSSPAIETMCFSLLLYLDCPCDRHLALSSLATDVWAHPVNICGAGTSLAARDIVAQPLILHPDDGNRGTVFSQTSSDSAPKYLGNSAQQFQQLIRKFNARTRRKICIVAGIIRRVLNFAGWIWIKHENFF